MIASFACAETERVFNGFRSARFPPDSQKSAQRKLLMLDATVTLQDLRVPPGNRLEALSGDRAGRHSICVNDQWRLCFAWRDGAAYGVELVDYH